MQYVKSDSRRDLDLSNYEPKDIPVKQLSAVLKDPHYRLQKLTLYKGGSNKEKNCAAVASALAANPSHIRELNLNGNKPGEKGTSELCVLLRSPHCKLEKLNLRKSIKQQSWAALASALSSNPSHIRELDLSRNDLGDTGMKNLSPLLANPECKLEKLLLCKSIGASACVDLASALCSNPSHIRELDLSENDLGVTGMKNLSPLLANPECKLEKLLLQQCSIGDHGTAALTVALRSNCSHLEVLDLRVNKLGDSVKELGELLKTTNCNLLLDQNWYDWMKSYFPSWSF